MKEIRKLIWKLLNLLEKPNHISPWEISRTHYSWFSSSGTAANPTLQITKLCINIMYKHNFTLFFLIQVPRALTQVLCFLTCACSGEVLHLQEDQYMCLTSSQGDQTEVQSWAAEGLFGRADTAVSVYLQLLSRLYVCARGWWCQSVSPPHWLFLIFLTLSIWMTWTHSK